MQMSATLKQLSEGFDNFSQSAQDISTSAENILNAGFQLSSIQAQEKK